MMSDWPMTNSDLATVDGHSICLMTSDVGIMPKVFLATTVAFSDSNVEAEHETAITCLGTSREEFESEFIFESFSAVTAKDPKCVTSAAVVCMAAETLGFCCTGTVMQLRV